MKCKLLFVRTLAHTNKYAYAQRHMTIYGRAMAQGLSRQLRRSEFNYRSVYVGVGVDKVKLRAPLNNTFVACIRHIILSQQDQQRKRQSFWTTNKKSFKYRLFCSCNL
jgi:hypothetical protein